MAGKRYLPEDIIAKLREADILISQGNTFAETIRRLAVSDLTYYRWRKEYGGMKTSQEKQIGSIGYRVEEDRLIRVYRNNYMDGEWERIEDSISFTWTSCNYGGWRQWFLCPKCN